MNRLNKFAILIILILIAACAAVGLSACNNNDVDQDTDIWDNRNGVKFGMVSDEACPSGNIDESKVKPDLEMQIGKEYYLIIDFTLQAKEDNDGLGNADVSITINPAATIDVTLHEAPSGMFTEETKDNVRQIKIQFSIPDKAEEARDRRIVLRLKPVMGSEQIVDVLFTADKPLAGNLTENTIKKTTTSQYTQGLVYSATDNDGYSVSVGDAKNQAEIVIPYFKDGKYITEIEANAFSGCKNLESITLPFVGASLDTSNDYYRYPFGYIFGTDSYDGGVGTMQYAYRDSSGIGSSRIYYIPSSLKSVTVTGGDIFYGAFYNCSGLTSINIGDSVKSIGQEAFYGCSSLQYNEYDNTLYLGNINNPYVALVKAKSTDMTSYTINENTKVICASAFYGCRSLTSIAIPNSITSIGDEAFRNCSSLTSLTKGNGVTTIGNYAFYGCGLLKNIEISNSITKIGNEVFSGCSSLQYNEYDNALYLGNTSNLYVVLVKSKSTGITSCEINENTKVICKSAFYNCRSLTSITIPNSIASIGDSAFCSCSSLASVTIDNNITSIGIYAFSGCSNLQTVYWNATACTISKPTNSSSYSLFQSCSALTQVVIGDNVNSIPRYAFRFCSGLTNVTIGHSVTAIGSYAFGECSNLAIVTIPNSVTKIEDYAFYGCSGLTSITIPDNVASIGKGAFYECSNLETVYWNAIACIGVAWEEAPIFGECPNLTTVVIADNVTTIPSKAFSYCGGLTSITIPDSVMTIGEWAFWHCSDLTSITIGNNVTIIGNGAFSDCWNLTNVIIPDSVINIEYSAFSGCFNLESITLGNSVTTIGEWAFYDCRHLTSVYYKGTADDWKKISIGDRNTSLTNATRYYS